MPTRLQPGWLQLILLPLTLMICAAIPIDVPPSTIWLSPPVTPSPNPPAPTTVLFVAGALTPPVACDLPDLKHRHHISADGSLTETESLASSPMVCRVRRDSCAYSRLINLDDPTIVFKREEKEVQFGEEDSLMHLAMVLPLVRLNQLVKAEWGGEYQLRITDAYDSLLEHNPVETEPEQRYSLHYEGRAVDLTLWPIEQDMYGRLCSLAHCAGFDYVENEISHCHASIKAESLCHQCDPIAPATSTPHSEANDDGFSAWSKPLPGSIPN